MNISVVKRQVIRAYILLLANALINLTFIISTVGFLVLGLLSVFKSQTFMTPSELVRAYALIFVAKLVWMVAYHFARKRIHKQFNNAGIEIGTEGTEQVTGMVNLLNDKTKELKRDKVAIMAKYRNDPERAKKELVLLHLKHGGRNES
jgi:hypothetical protein